MKKMLLVSTGLFVLIAACAVFSYTKSAANESSLILLNVEALAQSESGGIVDKDCYTVFHETEADEVYYASCSQVADGDIKYECGAISIMRPLWGITQQSECYQWV